MNKLDFAAINQSLNAESVVPMWLPDGKLQGNEWVSHNGSFSVNLRKGVWKDFSGGAGGADLVSLYAFLFHDNNQGAAARELSEENGIVLNAETRQRAHETKVAQLDEARPECVFPVPPEAPTPTFHHGKYGQPSRKFAYRDAAGDLMMYVCRFDPEGERKQVIPYSWCNHPEKDGKAAHSRWTWKGVTGKSKRPLFNLDKLAAMPDVDVIIVEGEKAAEAAQEIFGSAAACVTWMGGVETADRADVKALAGRRVFLWPDFDSAKDDEGNVKPLHEQPGMRAMMSIASNLKGVAREQHMVRYEFGQFEHGWDLADGQAEGWDLTKVMEYIGANTGDPVAVAAKQPAGRIKLDASVNPFGYAHVSDKGQPLNTVENLAYLFEQYGITARYNVIKKDVLVEIPGKKYVNDNASNCALAEINSICARNRMPVASTGEYIKLIADANSFNPAAEMIGERAWDGVSRLEELYDTLKTAPGYDRDLMKLLIRRWLISCVAAALKDKGFWSKGVLVFQGEQSLGKTAWIKALLPSARRELVKIGANIDPANKDSVSSAIGHWIVELGELDGTFRKADIAKLKAFISQDIDQLRRPYDRLESTYQRRTVFFASVNPEKFLADETGNVRWWTIPVIDVNYEHSIDVQQLWAEVATLFNAGESWWLSRDEEAALAEVNREHEAVDPLEERIHTMFDWTRKGMGTAMTATDVLISIGIDKPSKSQATDCSRLLQKLTGPAVKSGSRRVFKMPPRNNDNRFDYDERPF
jgi:putative DNA primase/helicase